MTDIQTRQQAREAAEIHQAGSWYIAALDNPEIAVQAASEAHALDKLTQRWDEYTTDTDTSDIQLGTANTTPEHSRVTEPVPLHLDTNDT